MEIERAKRLVVKAGSALLSPELSTAASTFPARLAADVARLRAAGAQVVIVSSGAVAPAHGALQVNGRDPIVP